MGKKRGPLGPFWGGPRGFSFFFVGEFPPLFRDALEIAHLIGGVVPPSAIFPPFPCVFPLAMGPGPKDPPAWGVTGVGANLVKGKNKQASPGRPNGQLS